VDEEAAGADRLQPRLAHGHPIVLAELFDLRRAAAEAGERGQHFGRRLMVEICVEQPFVGPGGVGLVGDQHRLRVGERQHFMSIGQRFRLHARARQGGAPAHRT